MKKTLLAMLLATCASAQGAPGLESLEKQPAEIPGLPDLKKPVYLRKDALACVSSYDIVGTARAYPTRVENPQVIAALRANGCAFSSEKMQVVVTLPDASSELYLMQKQWHFTGIFWRNPSGQIWRGYTMIDNLHN